MTPSETNYRRNPLAAAWILAGVICVMAFHPQLAAAQTGSADVCGAAKDFAAADLEVGRVATASYDEQVAVQEAWHKALAALAEKLPAGEARSAAETLRGAKTVTSNEEWTEEQSNAYSVLSQDLEQRCNIQLDR
ncbi:MAG: hypothetical protein ACREM1_00130 [Longimicrobiales bacterium]